MRMRNLSYLPPLLALLITACGTPDPGPDPTKTSSSQSSSSSTSPVEPPLSCRKSASEPILGQRRLLFLSSKQYKNALEDAGLAVNESVYARYLAYEFAQNGEDFVYNHSDHFSESQFQNFFELAIELTESQWPEVAKGCADTKSCQTSMVDFAETLFRRPLSEELANAYRQLISDYGLIDGIKTGMVSVLTSPHFLYIPELGEFDSEQQLYTLDAYELASVLSFMYLGSIPDQSLLDAAANNELSTATQIQAQIDRLILTPRGQQWVGHFAGQWVGTDQLRNSPQQNRSSNSALSESIKISLAEEVHQWFRYIFYNDDKTLASFFYDSEIIIDRNLAHYYGAEPFEAEPEFVDGPWRLAEDSDRGGILTTAAFMTTFAYAENTSPIRRATQLRKAFLCQHIPFPHALNTLFEEQHELAAAYTQNGDFTTREYYEYLTDHPVCDTCHKELINPLFGMEDFDHFGMPRTETRGYGENGIKGLKIDTHGILIGTQSTADNDAYVFNGTKELGKVLSDLPAVQSCFVDKSFRFLAQTHFVQPVFDTTSHLLPHENEQDQFACLKDYLVGELQSSQLQPKAVFHKVGTLDPVRYRK